MSDPLILAVDTALGACSAVLAEGDRVLAHRWAAMDRGHAEALAPMVEAVMRGVPFPALGKLAVTIGPGTFTGLRVGLAFMRGLRVALKVPLAGVTSLSAMAEQARHETGCRSAAAVHDARRDEVYLEVAGGSAQLLPFDEAVALLRPLDDLVVAGTAAARIADVLPVRRSPVVAPDAIWVARLGARIESASLPRPLYLRAPDAKIPKAR